MVVPVFAALISEPDAGIFYAIDVFIARLTTLVANAESLLVATAGELAADPPDGSLDDFLIGDSAQTHLVARSITCRTRLT